MENKRELYGVHLMNPIHCTLPGAIDNMPHNSGANVTFCSSKAEAHQFARAFAGNYEMPATRTKVGHRLDHVSKLPGVAIIYKVDCPEGVYKQLESINLMGAHVKRGSLDGMQLYPIEAYIQGDDLHPGATIMGDKEHTASSVSIYEVGAEIANRLEDYRKYQMSLSNSSTSELRLIDFNNLNVERSLQVMFGTTGRINTNFFTSQEGQDHMMAIERELAGVNHNGVMADPVGIGYIANLMMMEAQYNGTYQTLTANGCSQEYAACAASKEIVGMLQSLAKLFQTPEVTQERFQKLMQDYDNRLVEASNAVVQPEHEDEPETPFVEPTTDEEEIVT